MMITMNTVEYFSMLTMIMMIIMIMMIMMIIMLTILIKHRVLGEARVAQLKAGQAGQVLQAV